MEEPGAVFLCDIRGHVLRVVHDGFGMAEKVVTGQDLGKFMARDSSKTFRRFLKTVASKGTAFRSEVRCNDRELCIGLSLSGFKTGEGIIIVAVKAMPEGEFSLLYEEISSLNNELVNTKRELARKNAELDRLASTDGLTQLANRRVISEKALEHFKLARRYGIVFSLIMADIDHFKKVNDQYGHVTGDAVLRQVGSIISGVIRDTDHAGRYGGEEILIVLANTGLDEACRVAERIRRDIKARLFTTENEKQFGVTVSMGVAEYNGEGELKNLIERADRALYRAKDAGRNRVEV